MQWNVFIGWAYRLPCAIARYDTYCESLKQLGDVVSPGDEMDKENRKFLRLRKAVNEAPSAPKLAMILMAKMLPPEKLAEIDSELGRHYAKERMIRLCGSRRGIAPAEIEAIIQRFETPAALLPKDILQKPMAGFGLDKQTLGALRFCKIENVADFVLKDRKQFELIGLSSGVVKETEDRLFEFGIRHKDNPPAHLSEPPSA
jgi:hypothetical protein